MLIEIITAALLPALLTNHENIITNHCHPPYRTSAAGVDRKPERMKKKIEIQWNYNLDEAPESEVVLASIINQYDTPETVQAQKYNGRWHNEVGDRYRSAPYAWAFIPKPAQQPKTKKG